MKRILLIDDNAILVRSLTRLLKGAGYSVYGTVSAHAGIQELRRRSAVDSFDFVITDFDMPEMNGADVVHAVRLFRRELPILVMSGRPDARREIPQDVPFLDKPVFLEELVRHIDG